MAKERKALTEIFPSAKNSQDAEEEDHIAPVREQIQKFELKTNAHWSKGKAPLPPGQQMNLPKIGNYKPKSLLQQQTSVTSESSEVYSELTDLTITASEKQENADLILRQKIEDHSISPSETDTLIDRNDSGIMSPGFTQNPLFGLEEPTIPAPGTPPPEIDYSVGDIDPLLISSPPIDYPIQGEPNDDDSTPIPSPRRKKKDRKEKRTAPAPPPLPARNEGFELEPEIDYPYIPAPDYEGDTSSSLVENEHSFRPASYHGLSTVQENVHALNGHARSVQEGEDYSRYLSEEEDYEFDMDQRWRNNNRYIGYY